MRASVEERFFAKVIPAGPDECWLWTAALTRNQSGNYGVFNACPEPVMGAHRWAYQFMIGPIPEGFDIDHLCKVTSCVNPYHMEPVPRWVNILRAGPAQRTNCARGHEYNSENTSPVPGTRQRRCRQCSRENSSAHGERKRRAASN